MYFNLLLKLSLKPDDRMEYELFLASDGGQRGHLPDSGGNWNGTIADVLNFKGRQEIKLCFL